MLTKSPFDCNHLDYGYTCRYTREIKKRGRAPANPTAHHHNSKHLSLETISPSPPLTSPEATVQPLQFRQSDERHRGSFTSTRDDGRPSISHIATRPSPTLGGPPSYLASPVYSTGHSQMHLSSLLESTYDTPLLRSSDGSPPQMSAGTGRTTETEAIGSDDSNGYGSPAAGGTLHSQSAESFRGRDSFVNSVLSSHQEPGSFRTSTAREESIPEIQRAQNSLYNAPSADCRYRCLDPVLPYLRDIIPASVACDLIDVYLTEPGSSLFRCASPYIITRIFRQKSLLHPTNPRRTTPALLATMLWCSAQTADIVLLHVPGSRAKICNALYELSTALVSDRDPDRWRRIHGTTPPEPHCKGPRLIFHAFRRLAS